MWATVVSATGLGGQSRANWISGKSLKASAPELLTVKWWKEACGPTGTSGLHQPLRTSGGAWSPIQQRQHVMSWTGRAQSLLPVFLAPRWFGDGHTETLTRVRLCVAPASPQPLEPDLPQRRGSHLLSLSITVSIVTTIMLAQQQLGSGLRGAQTQVPAGVGKPPQ